MIVSYGDLGSRSFLMETQDHDRFLWRLRIMIVSYGDLGP